MQNSTVKYIWTYNNYYYYMKCFKYEAMHTRLLQMNDFGTIF